MSSDHTTHYVTAWALTRKDGQRLGFTDHDLDVIFDGLTFRADTGFSGFSVAQNAGLSPGSSEALGVLRDDAISPADLRAGRYDGAQVTIWRVNWRDVTQRVRLFSGVIGDTAQTGIGFRAKILGLSDLLSRPIGRVYQIPCSAVLGDQACRVALSGASYTAQFDLSDGLSGGVLDMPADDLSDFAAGWFAHGALRVRSGAAQGLWAPIKSDDIQGKRRRITLWSPLPQIVESGSQIALEAGCDKRAETCKVKFDNIINYQGFPDLPPENYVLQSPAALAASGLVQ